MNQLSRAHFMKGFMGVKKTNTLPSGSATNNVKANAKTNSARPYTGPWRQEQIMHLLRRTLFGVTQEDYVYFSKLTLKQSLDILLTQAPMPSPPLNAYNDKSYTDPDVPFGKTWVNAPFGNLDGNTDYRRVVSLKSWWVGLMINQDRSITEKMTLFWSNHFGGIFFQMKDSRYDYRYLAQLRSNPLGNFKKLTRQITTNVGTLVFLNGNSNTAAAPNENYGRELQELFTVGKGPDSHYTEADVRNAARVLTGWQDDMAALNTKFNTSIHDTANKEFSAFYNNTIIKGLSGADGANETDDLINMIFNQHETAKYFCRRLYHWFVSSEINYDLEANLITPLADLLVKSNFEVKPVLRMLLGSEHFFDSLNFGCQIKNPIDFLIGTCRQLKVSFPSSSELAQQYQAWDVLSKTLANMTMDPGDPPNVAGWPAYYLEPIFDKVWINSNTLPYRNSVTDALCSDNGFDPFGTGALKFDLLKFTAQLPSPADPDKLIENSTAFLIPNKFDTIQITYLKKILLAGQPDNQYCADIWNKYTGAPNDSDAKNAALNRLIPYYSYILERAEYQMM